VHRQTEVRKINWGGGVKTPGECPDVGWVVLKPPRDEREKKLKGKRTGKSPPKRETPWEKKIDMPKETAGGMKKKTGRIKGGGRRGEWVGRCREVPSSNLRKSQKSPEPGGGRNGIPSDSVPERGSR